MDSQQLRQTGEDYLIRSSLLSDVVAASGGPVFVRAEGSEVWDRDDAIKFFKDKGEAYKAELIEAIPAGEDVSMYRQGDWIGIVSRFDEEPKAVQAERFHYFNTAGGDHVGYSNMDENVDFVRLLLHLQNFQIPQRPS